MLLIATVLFARVCGETQFAGLQVGVIDTDLEARLVLIGSTSSLRFQGACERAAAYSRAHGEPRSMPSSHVSVRYLQVQPHRARTRAGGGAALDNARERRFGNGREPRVLWKNHADFIAILSCKWSCKWGGSAKGTGLLDGGVQCRAVSQPITNTKRTNIS